MHAIPAAGSTCVRVCVCARARISASAAAAAHVRAPIYGSVAPSRCRSQVGSTDPARQTMRPLPWCIPKGARVRHIRIEFHIYIKLLERKKACAT